MSTAVSKAVASQIAKLVAADDKAGLVELRGKLVSRQEGQRVKFNRTRSVTDGETYRRYGNELSAVKTAIRSMESKDGKLSEEALVEGLGDMIASGVKNAADRVAYGLGSHEARGRLDLNAAKQYLMKDWKAYVGRHAAAGDTTIKTAPTLAQLAEFMHFQYGIDIGEEELERIASMAPAAPADTETKEAPAKAEKKPMFGKRREPPSSHDFKFTSESEFKALRAQFVTETQIEEATADEITFDPKVLFPKLANLLIQHGIITVSREGGLTAGSVAKQAKRADGNTVRDDAPKVPEPSEKKKDDKKTVSKEEGLEISNMVTADGHKIDVVKLAKTLEEHDFKEEDMNDIRKIVAKGDEAIFRSRMSRRNELADKIALVVSAVLSSISKDNAEKNVKKEINITKSGNTVNIETFGAILQKADVGGKELNALRSDMQQGTLADAIEKGGKTAKVAMTVCQALLGATVTVADTKQQPEAAKEGPGAAPAPQAAAPEAQ